jgi:hypothetical protein
MIFLGLSSAARRVIILVTALMAASSHAQEIFLKQVDVLPDAAPDGWTIEDGRVTQKDGSGSIGAFTWTKPPLEIDEEGFSVTMTIEASANVKTRMEVSGSFIADPPQARSIDTDPKARPSHQVRSSRHTASVKIRPPEIAETESTCELRIETHAAYGVTYRYRVVK